MEMATYVLNNCKTPELMLVENELVTDLVGNSCFCPVVAARGWALLSLMGNGETRKQLTVNVAKCRNILKAELGQK